MSCKDIEGRKGKRVIHGKYRVRTVLSVCGQGAMASGTVSEGGISDGSLNIQSLRKSQASGAHAINKCFRPVQARQPLVVDSEECDPLFSDRCQVGESESGPHSPPPM